MTEFFQRLKQRKLVQWGVAYVAAGFALLQGIDIVAQQFAWTEGVRRGITLALVVGFFVILVLAWYHGERGAQRVSGTELIILAVLLAIGGGGIWRYSAARAASAKIETNDGATTVASRSVFAKSIAVLPFENLSHDPDNAYFADGIQDEILTRLAKIGDLKVISRTSTQRYTTSPDDLPKIAQQLGVAHMLEGSVQKAGEQVRVTVQLIRAASDSHLWAETYDRKLTDIFAVESEVAEKIAHSLQLQLSGAEKEAVSAKPTDNPEAYEDYLRGLALWNSLTTSPQVMEKNVLYLDRAVQLDPEFGLAWATLSAVHTFIYAEYERTPQRLGQAKAALDNALRLNPDSGETQFALGMYRYRGLADYDGALSAFEKARARAANRVESIEFSAYVKRRQGKWDEALALHRESLQLDPRNPILLSEAALTNRAVRNFREAGELVDRALELEPTSSNLVAQKAEIRRAQGDLTGATQLIERMPLDPKDATVFGAHVRGWMVEGKYGKAIDALRKVLAAPDDLSREFTPNYRAWLGIVESLAGHTDARVDLARAHEELTALRAGGDKGPRIVRDLILAAGFLHDKAAVERHASEVQKEIQNDAVDGPGFEAALAMARAQLGEKDAAIASVAHLLETYGEVSLTPALLRLDPLWNPLRSDPRFLKLANPSP
jgi:TolB-like protein/Tfp pilus assembly protein PilF